MSSTPAKIQHTLEEPQLIDSLSAKRGSTIDARELERVRQMASTLKVEVKKVKQVSKNLVEVLLPVDVTVGTPHQSFLRFLANPNVSVVCDPQNPIVIPKGSKVHMDGNTLRVLDVTEALGCMIRMGNKNIRFKDAPCQVLPNQQFYFIESLSVIPDTISDANVQMVINDADIKPSLPTPTGKIIGEKPENRALPKAA